MDSTALVITLLIVLLVVIDRVVLSFRTHAVRGRWDTEDASPQVLNSPRHLAGGLEAPP